MFKNAGLFFPACILMFFLALLLFVFSLFDLKDALIWLPSFFAMQDEVAISVQAIGHFWKRVVSAVVAEPDFFIKDSILFPAEVALVDESPDAANLTSVKGEQLDAHLNSYILKCKISTDEPNVEALLFFFLLFEVGDHFCHLLFIVFAGNPSLFIIWLARRRWYFPFRLDWYWNPFFLLGVLRLLAAIISILFSLCLIVGCFLLFWVILFIIIALFWKLS